MAKKPTPWYWDARDSWFVKIEGKRHFLGLHPEKATKPVKSRKTGRWNSPPEIDEAFRKLLNNPTKAKSDTVVVVLDDFITWTKENRAKLTAFRYEEFIQDFVNSKDGGPKFGALPIDTLSSKHVTAWLNQKPKWGPTTRRNAITAISRGLNWAVKNRGVARNPLKGMDKPKANERTEFLTPEEFEKLIQGIYLPALKAKPGEAEKPRKPDDRFRELLIVSYDSGARPFEIKELEARHVQMDRQRAVIPKEEAKGRKKARVFYFPTERSLAIVKKRIEQFPEGPLFRNRLGHKWTAEAVKCRMQDLDHILGRRVCHYALRHSRITDWLTAGVDSHIVAKLSGHHDTKMLDNVYSHVAENYEFMLENAKKKAASKE